MRSSAVLLLTALPAAAHEGAHLHPHGSGAWMVLAGGLAILAAVGALGWHLWRTKE